MSATSNGDACISSPSSSGASEEKIAGFWARVDKGTPNACWPWLGSRNERGYGQVSWLGRHTGTHRIAFTLAKGEIPQGRMVLHRCDCPSCCNPRHLYAGTAKHNSADIAIRGRRLVKITDEQVLEIRRRSDAGETAVSIARDFDASLAHVQAIARRSSRQVLRWTVQGEALRRGDANV